MMFNGKNMTGGGLTTAEFAVTFEQVTAPELL